jgi:hypothetical protein
MEEPGDIGVLRGELAPRRVRLARMCRRLPPGLEVASTIWELERGELGGGGDD